MGTMTCIRFTCSHCDKPLKAPERAAGKWTRCPSCRMRIQIPGDCLETPDTALTPAGGDTNSLDSLQMPGGASVRPVVPTVPAIAPADRLYPWETAQSVLIQAEAYRQAGRFKAYPCKVEEFLEGLLRWQVFKSIKQWAKQKTNLAELHVYPSLVGVVERPPEPPGEASRLLSDFLMLFLPIGVVFWIIDLISNLFWLGIALAVTAVGVFFLVAEMGILTMVVTAVTIVTAGTVLKRLYLWLSLKHTDRVAERIHEDPKSPYAVKQMYKRAGWIRWRSGIGRGQSGRAMSERYWREGDVVQLVRVDARRRLFKRSLLLMVMDRPIPDSPGLNRIGLCLVLKRAFRPQRRIYVVDFEDGAQAADAAAQEVSRVLDVPVRQGCFGLLALSLSNDRS
jgi:hypothetical protein